EMRKDLRVAAKLYDDAWALADRVGPLAQPEREMAVNGLISVRMPLAVEAQKRGDYNEANLQVSDVLRVDPKNQTALQFATANNVYIEAMRPLTPTPQAIERVKQVKEEQVQTSQILQDGKLLFQLGKIDESELKLHEVLARDPNNQGALYYLSLVKQVRIRQE